MKYQVYLIVWDQIADLTRLGFALHRIQNQPSDDPEEKQLQKTNFCFGAKPMQWSSNIDKSAEKHTSFLQ
jgi:hypothetical protein